jgi:hypothetical protein
MRLAEINLTLESVCLHDISTWIIFRSIRKFSAKREFIFKKRANGIFILL